MKNRVILVIALLVLLIDCSSCRMHYEYGTPYKVWHVTGRTHRHWGAPKYSNSPTRYWSRHRYGPRPHSYRGRYRY